MITVDINVPFDEAVRALREKVPMSDEAFEALQEEARVRAFGVRGINDEAAVAEILQHLGDAAAEGLPFGEFRKRMVEALEARRLGPMAKWRTETMFRTNMLTAYSAGRYAQMTDPPALKTRGYWQYDAIDDARTRPAHRALDGKVFRFDDEAADQVFPPNGFNCRCTTRSVRNRDVEAGKVKASKGADVAGRQAVVDGRYTVMAPDPGFFHNPGKAFFGMPRELPARAKWERIGDQDGGKRARAKPLETLPHEVFRQVAMTAAATDADIRAQLGIERGGENAVYDGTGRIVVLTERLVQYLHGKSGEERGQFIAGGLSAIREPFEVWLQAQRDANTGRVVLRRVHLGLVQAEGRSDKTFVVVSEARLGRWEAWTLHPAKDMKNANNKRWGVLVYARD